MAASTIDPAIVQHPGAVSPALEEALLATAKELARTVPAPRDDPYYGLDRAGGPSLRALERLTRHGDFRKYVFVLDAGAGLGGGARWLALRHGCRVVGLDPEPGRVAALARLSRRAGLGDRVCGIAGTVTAIPARDGAFTQVWCVERLRHEPDLAGALAELRRVLRPGSPLALQEIVRRPGAAPAPGRPRRLRTLAEYRDALRTAGFVDVTDEDVTAEREETSPVVLAARRRLARALAGRLPPDTPRDGAAGAAAPGEGDAVAQLFARRPSA